MSDRPDHPTESPPTTPPSTLSPIPINGIEDSRQALVHLLTDLRRQAQMYLPVVDGRLLNDDEVVAVWRRRCIAQPRLRFQLILPPAHEWRTSCPHFLATVERLSSAFELRTLPLDHTREGPEYGQGMLVADETAFIQLTDPLRLMGIFSAHEPARAREWLGFFREIWAKSEPDMELRKMRI